MRRDNTLVAVAPKIRHKPSVLLARLRKGDAKGEHGSRYVAPRDDFFLDI